MVSIVPHVVVGIVVVLAIIVSHGILFGQTIPGHGLSMRHGDRQLGIMDDGDETRLVPVDRREDVTTFVVGRSRSHEVAGDFGDVIVFKPDGQDVPSLDRVRMYHDPDERVGETEPRNSLVAHRAMVWVDYNPQTETFDVPELGLSDVVVIPFTGVGSYNLTSGGYQRGTSLVFLVDMDESGAILYPVGKHSGFLTKGDGNDYFDQALDASSFTPVISEIVKVEWIVGKVESVADRETVQQFYLAGIGIFAATQIGSVLTLRLKERRAHSRQLERFLRR